MNITDNYKLMCENASEIQNSDFIRDENSFFIYSESFEKGGFEIWIPRQDQLQDMMFISNGGHYTIIDIIQYFNKFVANIYTNFHGFNELWLAFYMYDTYNKKWNKNNLSWE